MPDLAVSNPTSVARSGSTLAWSNLANSIASDNAYGTCSPFDPGDKSELIQIELDAPGVALLTLPSTIRVAVEMQVDPDDGTGTWIVDDLVKFGTALDGPMGSNAAQTQPVGPSDTVRFYDVPTDAYVDFLTKLNAGDICLFLGYKATPDAPFDPLDWTVSVSPTSPRTTSGNTGPLALTTAYVVTATWIGVGDAPPYVPLSLHSVCKAGVFTFVGNPTWTGTASADNGIGDTDSGAISGAGSNFRLADSTEVFVESVSGGVATKTATLVGSASVNTPDVNRCPVTILNTLTALVTDPEPSTLKVDSIVLSYNEEDPPASVAALMASEQDGRIPDWNVRSLNDVSTAKR